MDLFSEGEVLCIVGSRCLKGSEKARKIVREVLYRYNPAMVISGGAVGVDTIAEQVALETGTPFKKFLPSGKGWKYYKKRDVEMAKACTRLVCITGRQTITFGARWTRNRAAEMGKPTEEYVLD